MFQFGNHSLLLSGTERQTPNEKATNLSAWLRTVLHLYGDRVLPFDGPTAEIAGVLADLARGRSHSPSLADIAIAATARRHGLTILSRNTRHFELLEQGLHQRPWSNLLQIAVDDSIAFRDPVEDRYEAAVAGTEGNETLICLVSLADDIDVFAKLT